MMFWKVLLYAFITALVSSSPWGKGFYEDSDESSELYGTSDRSREVLDLLSRGDNTAQRSQKKPEVDVIFHKGFGTVTYRHLRCSERSNGDSGFEDGSASGLEEGSASGLEEGSASGLEEGSAGGLEEGSASGLEEGSASGLEEGNASGLEEGSASGLEEGSASGFEESGSGFEEGSGEEETAGIREIVVLMLDKPPRRITMTRKLFEQQQWLFERAENASCVPFASCFNEDDCDGHTCTGLSLNKCDCGACMTFSPCEDDSACGGLIGACNNNTKTCDCDKGFRENGVDGMFGALTTVCNIKDCTPNSDSCFGLPCNKGVCSCV
ncbi:unnamed protein product [Toxocara canis]|uniref:Chondroitin proteoglycan 3 n=1 Tax=Toxocara canis TaxID=6265 RepID=A0A183TUW6_TOXCA|nr:unnamed protein product [Toxocara canis]